MQHIVKYAIFITLTTLSLSAFSAPMAQRNCKPSDLQIDSNSAVETTCNV